VVKGAKKNVLRRRAAGGGETCDGGEVVCELEYLKNFLGVYSFLK
jgi:hypothetical protein